jgi:hypothetical protein
MMGSVYPTIESAICISTGALFIFLLLYEISIMNATNVIIEIESQIQQQNWNLLTDSNVYCLQLSYLALLSVTVRLSA